MARPTRENRKRRLQDEGFDPKVSGDLLDVSSLSELPAILKKAMRIRPLECPPGTDAKLREEHAGLYEWCEDGQGRRRGPYRSWFSTALHLMDEGEYEDDRKVGRWTECSRFETCVSRRYGNEPQPGCPSNRGSHQCHAEARSGRARAAGA
jgi:hypothetical protein